MSGFAGPPRRRPVQSFQSRVVGEGAVKGFPRLIVFISASICGVAAAQEVPERVPERWRAAVHDALAAAGGNRAELEKALKEAAGGDELEIVAFTIAQSAYRYAGGIGQAKTPDCRVLKAEFILGNARRALAARGKWPWTAALDRERFLRFVASYRLTTEKVEAWWKIFLAEDALVEKVEWFASRYRRAGVEERGKVFRGLVHWLNSGWLAKRVKFKRRGMPDLAPSELLRSGTGRCTDLTIALVALCRSFGLAATAARVVWWPRGRGNHLWALVRAPDEKRWLSVESAAGGEATDDYFKRYSSDPKHPVGKVYVIVPGLERGEVWRRARPRDGEWTPEYLDWYLCGRPMLDATPLFAPAVATVEMRGLAAGKRFFLAVFNSGLWLAVDTARADSGGVVRFERVGAGDLLYAVCEPFETVDERTGGKRKVLRPARPPFVLAADGGRTSVEDHDAFEGDRVEAEVPGLPAGAKFRLFGWTMKKGWTDAGAGRADGKGLAVIKDVAPGGLYVIVFADGKRRRRTRPFVVERR